MKFFGKYKGKVLNNILGIGLFRFLGILANFYLLGLIFRYLSNEELYGVWLTISSLLTFAFLFDLGIGNGLRNKLTAAINDKNSLLANQYISTTYILMTIPTFIMIMGSLIIFPHISWDVLFNISSQSLSNNYFVNLTIIVFSLFSIQFYFSLIFAVLHSLFKSYMISVLQFLIYIVNIIIITILYFVDVNSLILMATFYVGSAVLVLLISTIVLFKYGSLKFSFKLFEWSLVKDLLNVGLHFLVLQFAIIVLFNTDNIIISKFLGAGEVPAYQITYKLLSLFTIILGIILTPIWSLMIEYNTSKNYEKMKTTSKKIVYLFIILSIGTIILTVLSPYIIKLWLGEPLNLTGELLISLCLFVILHMWCNIYQSILNGLNRLGIQVITYGIAAVLNIPLSIFLVQNTELGIVAIILGSIISMIIPALILPFYTYNLFKKMFGA